MRINPLMAAAAQGRHGDTMIAHINPREAAMLKAMGGAGTINPKTGLPEFYDAADYGDAGGASGLAGGGYDANGGAPDPGGDYLGGEGQDVIGNDMGRDDIAGAPADGIGPNEWTGRQDWGWLGAQIGRAADRPAETAINAAAGMIPGVGWVNSLLGWAGGPTIGSLTTGAARGLTGYNEDGSSGLAGWSGQSVDQNGDPIAFDGGGLPGLQANDPGGKLNAAGYVNSLISAAQSAAPGAAVSAAQGGGGGGGGGGSSFGSYGGYSDDSSYEEWQKRFRKNQLVL